MLSDMLGAGVFQSRIMTMGGVNATARSTVQRMAPPRPALTCARTSARVRGAVAETGVDLVATLSPLRG